MNYFERFAQLGYTRLVPVIPPTAEISKGSSLFKRLGTKQDGRGKTPGIRGRDGKFFSFDWVPYEADATDCARWHAMGAGVGIKTGRGLVGIDAEALIYHSGYRFRMQKIAFKHSPREKTEAISGPFSKV